MVLKYHGKLQGYNATVKKNATTIAFNLARNFQNTEPEIQIGVMQFLLNKLNRTKIHADNINMYHSFLKKMSDIAPVTMSDPALETSFQRVNEQYFGGMLSQPNLIWGRFSVSLLGTYTYATDTIMISAAMKDEEFISNYVEEVRESRQYVQKELEKLGIKVFSSEANFMMVDFGERCNYVLLQLRERGILVRDRSTYPLLKNCIRYFKRIQLGKHYSSHHFMLGFIFILIRISPPSNH